MCGTPQASASPMSAPAMSTVWAGSPYMRSILTLSKLASAAPTALRASAAPWMRPSAPSMRSSKLCTPSEMRFTPASRKPRKRAASTVPGFASSAICGMQQLEEAPRGERAMTDAVLLGRRELGRGLTERRHQEQRVVAEAIAATGRARDLAAPDAFGDERPRIVGAAQEDHQAAIVGAAALAEAREQFRVIARIALIPAAAAARVVGRMHARLAAQRIDAKARIIGGRRHLLPLRRRAPRVQVV